MVKKQHILSAPDNLQDILAAAGQPAFRAKQITGWICDKLIYDPAKMTNIPAALKKILQDTYDTSPPCCITEVQTSPDGTKKMLLELADGECIEAVLIPAPGRMTLCLSTQVGCPVRCRFCASGQHGLKRQMAAHEITGELYAAAEVLGRLPDNIVFMGIGEGLLNFENTAAALEFFSSPERLGISPRRITVSTSGIVPGIEKLAALGKPFNLALSLHAPDEKTRAGIIPDGFRYPIPQILDAVDNYARTVNRMPTFEYTLIAGVNDSPEQAEATAKLANRIHAKVNLIACNPADTGYTRPTRKNIDRFLQILTNAGVHATLRQEKGSSKDAACGQLRASRQKEKDTEIL